jgi:DUF1365 family protein
MFQYRLFFILIDLEELPSLFDIHPLWSYQRWNVACFRRQDHFGDPSVAMDTAVRDLVQTRLGSRPQGPIRLLTHLRYFGYCFNPASFYYCYDTAAVRVETIVVEIHNTPWRERHCYVLGDLTNEHPNDQWRRFCFKKQFHVSPFIDMDIQYDWRFRVPDDTIRVHMIDLAQGEKIFDASLMLNRRHITRNELTRVLVQYPLMTMKVTAMIYLQALRLWLKNTPFFTHPQKRF